MIKKKLPLLIITSIIILIPMLVGLLLWGRLPEEVAVHWNARGEVDGYAHKAMMIFGLPGFMLLMHWLCSFVTSLDPKNKDIDGKPLTLVLWICPIMSLLVGSIVFATALGYEISVEIVMPLAMGLVFVIVGNYLPKCKQNYTIGIKLPWTLNDSENWNKTHRFSGIVWTLGGVVIMATSFLGSFLIFMIAVAVMVLILVVYSYIIYKNSK